MIITLCLNVVVNLLVALFNFLPSLPALPETVTAVMNSFSLMLKDGFAIIGNWFNMPLVVACLALAVPVAKFHDVYALIQWFLRKIPFLNIK